MDPLELVMLSNHVHPRANRKKARSLAGWLRSQPIVDSRVDFWRGDALHAQAKLEHTLLLS